MKLPKIVEDVAASFEKLPGIGRRSALRLAFYLLRMPQRDLEMFANSVANLKKQTMLCSICHNLTDQEQCSICADPARDASIVCVVESFTDVIALEKSGSYKGFYHVLHGSISPLNNVGPEELFIDTLVRRVKEGEATALYIKQALDGLSVQITRLGRGLPTGVEIEYADEVTLHQALLTRRAA